MAVTKKRKDCFFGLHFDFHAKTDQINIGEQFDAKLLEDILDQIKPDFVQCDTKGHPGASSYSTKVGFPAPQIKKDILREWRRVTEQRGIPLYAHYSGVMDEYQVNKHPENRVVMQDGNVHQFNNSLISNYAQDVVIPQLVEIATEYRLDGVWEDGDCWALEPDYSQSMQDLYLKETGKTPAKKGEEGYFEYVEFNRQKFYDFIRKIYNGVKAKAPDFEFTSNWLYSSQAPNEYDVPVDYISGDLSPTCSIDAARYETRVMANYDKPHDIMSWGISFPVHHVKTAVQLSQEAAAVISNGCGYQIYTLQHPIKTLKDDWAWPILKEVCSFVSQRKNACHNVKSKAKVAIVESIKAFYDKKETMFNIYGNDYNLGIKGTLFALLDNGIPTDILLSHKIDKEKLKQNDLLVLTDATIIEEEIKSFLLDFVKQGKKLIITGANTLLQFQNEFGYKVINTFDKKGIAKISSFDGQWQEVRKSYCEISPDNLNVLCQMYKGDIYGDPELANPPPKIEFERLIPAMFTTEYGKGQVIGVCYDFGGMYLEQRTVVLKDAIALAVDKLIDRQITVDKPYIDVTINTKNQNDIINLVNLLGEHRSSVVKTFDYIPPVYNVKVEYSCDYLPSKIIDGVTGVEFAFEIKDKKVTFTVDKLEIHSAIILKK